VAPGAYRFAGGEEPRHEAPAGDPPTTAYEVVWWDPHVLALDAGTPFGLRRDDLIAKDGAPAAVGARLAAYESWAATRRATIARASTPSIRTATATAIAGNRELPLPDDSELEVIDLSRLASRPYGPRFGTFVHATLATVPLDAGEDAVRRIAETQGRILLGFGEGVEEEVYAGVEVVLAVLRHPLFDRVRAADAGGRCYRELPIIWQAPDGILVEGTIDLAFEEGDVVTVLDFKTDRELDADSDRYRRQLAIYCRALAALKGRPTRGVLMRV
jgi:ATP-dependent exoDNAse (exonuclease V) beta subunit